MPWVVCAPSYAALAEGRLLSWSAQNRAVAKPFTSTHGLHRDLDCRAVAQRRNGIRRMRRAARAVGALGQRLGANAAQRGEPVTGVPRLFSGIARGSAAAVTHDPAQRARDARLPQQSLPFALRHVRFESTGGGAPALQQPVALDQPAGEATSSLSSSVDDITALAADSNLLVGALQRSIDWVHVTHDLPWWLSIAAVTVALRVAIVPAVVVQMRNTAKLTVRAALLASCLLTSASHCISTLHSWRGQTWSGCSSACARR